MKIECGGLLFTSDFDSGNLDKVEYVENLDTSKSKLFGDTSLPPITTRCIRRQKSHPESPVTSPVHSKKYPLKRRTLHSRLKSTVSAESVCAPEHQQRVREFRVWTKPDCSGTPYQTTFRTWFYFGVSGCPPGGLLVKLSVVNLNRQGKLYFHGMKPVYRSLPPAASPTAAGDIAHWKRIPGKVDFRCGPDGNFEISFCHPLPPLCTTYFAFTYPFSYSECQQMLDEIDQELGSSLHISKNNKPPESALYYCRELVCETCEGNRVDLVTVTSCKGLTHHREEGMPGLFPEGKPRCHLFRDKKVVFVSGRVHPGETPSSHVLNGILRHLTSSKETAANRLRNLFVFKLIPMLNPDGVRNGHYRADTRGLNLNRVYMVADARDHPSVHAARTLLLHYHRCYASPANKRTKNCPTTANKAGSKKTSKISPKEVLKTPVRKHPLHTSDTLTRNLDFLASLPSAAAAVGLPPMVGADGLRGEGGNSLLREESKDVSGGSCRECNPSRKGSGSEGECVGGASVEAEEERVPPLLPEESGIAYYFDLHGHASKRGCFIYGNYFHDTDQMVECMLLPKLMSVNCPYFDFSACNFSAENMHSASSAQSGKEGSGRVSLRSLTGIVHSYTLECNYNTCRYAPNNQKRRATGGDPPQVYFTPEVYHQIGESLLVSLLDAVGCNPKSLLPSSPLPSLEGVREWLRQHALSLRGRGAPLLLPGRKATTPMGLRVPDKVLTRSMTIRRSLFSSSNKGLRQDSSSSSANPSDPENRTVPSAKPPRSSRSIRGATRSLLSSPVTKKATLLQRRHTFVQDLPPPSGRGVHRRGGVVQRNKDHLKLTYLAVDILQSRRNNIFFICSYLT